jgi:mono/diheme cytochrome c family protein
VAALLVGGVGVGLNGGRAQPPAPPAAAKNGSGQVVAAVQGLYRQRCQRCHEADGNGQASEAPNFADARWQQTRSDVQLLISILDGKGPSMPGFRGKITDEQARGLVALVRAFAGNGNGGPAADFGSKFRQLQHELEELQRQFQELAEPAQASRRRR